MQGDNPEHAESSAGEYVRSYDTEDDVLSNQRSGFWWTAVQAAGGTARSFEEFMAVENKPVGATADPEAQVADGDLAVGKTVDEISPSRYWKSSAIVVEDDSQNGVDHVDGHRSPVQVISPWAKHGKVDSTY